ncbi:MAG: type II secretion system inner membrane protein GspF [Gammaproteobacteria bacterium]
MGAFEYTAVDSRGKEQKGVLEGDTAKQVRQLLREKKLLPIEVSEVVKTEARRSASLGLRRGLSAADLALITRQLATLVQSGLPLEEALRAIAEQHDKPRLKSIILGVRAKVMEGHALADGLAEFPQAFPEIYKATVAAGEQSGHLDAVLERLADFTEGRQVLRQKVSSAMIYPIVLTGLAITIVSFLLAFVVPKVVSVFENTGNELPAPTRILISVSDFMRDYWWLLLVIVAGIIFGIRAILQNEPARRRFHRFLLRIPVVGRLVQGVNTARFTRTLSILAGSGVPVLESFRISGAVVGNIPMREAVTDAAARVREGGAIGKSLATSGLFPPMTLHLISSGEASGQLETMLNRAATNQERELDGIISALLAIMEPALIVLMGLVVLAIVVSMLLPLFELNQLVG